MGILTDRVGQGLESLADKFKARLRGWLVGIVSVGIEAFMNIMAKSAAKDLAPLIAKIKETADLPPEFKKLLDEIENPSGEFAAALATRAGSAAIGSSLGKIVDYLTRPITVALSYAPEYVIMDIDNAIALYWRHKITGDELYALGRKHGLNAEFIDQLLLLKQLRFPSDIVFQLYHRDNNRWSKFVDDLRQIGIDEDRIIALQELSWKVPGTADVIRFAVREVYTPDIAEKFGQYEDYPTIAEKDAEAAGIRPDDLKKHWAAHWDLPGVSQGFDLFHRGLISKDELLMLLRALDVMPFWRERLIGLSYDLPNRIELRMMARYGLIDKANLVQILLKTGVDPQYVDLIADMNIAVGLITDLRTRYGNGYISADQIKTELAAAGLSPEIQERLYQYIVRVEKETRVVKEKDLTAAEIVKSVVRGYMTVDQGIAALMQLGYDNDEATLKLALGVPEEKEAPMPEYVKVNIDTIRRQRRAYVITHAQEVTALLGQGVSVDLAEAYANNDDIRKPEAEVTE